MRLPDFIAKRYLFAGKSLGVINIISAISAAGIAIGCAALIIILSVYNGFDSLVLQLNSTHTADLKVTPVEGKTFSPDTKAFDALRTDAHVVTFCEILEENVFLKYGEKNAVAVARGVDSLYERATGLRDYIVEGSFDLTFGEIQQVVVGRMLAYQLGLRPAFGTPLEVYFPSRTKQVDMLNPLSSLHRESLFPSGIVSLEQNFDQKYIFLPISSLRKLLEYGTEVSAVELHLAPEALDSKGFATKDFQNHVRELLGEGFTVQNKQQQNQMLYRLLLYEKIAIYLILLFIIIIISFNIFSSLSMLIIEKREDIEVLRAMGADNTLVKRIFVQEGWFISLLGVAAGVVAGLAVCLLQQKFGFVKMPGNFVVDAYPVVIQWSDVLLSAILISAIGYLAARLSRRLAQ